LDDFARNNVEWFLSLFANAANEFYIVEDSVLVILLNITERGACDIHYFTWNKEWGLAGFRHIVKEVLDYVFFVRKVHHVVGYIPECNQQAVRFAIGAGLRFEGEIRENFLYEGKYYATHVYGLLDREYTDVRRRL
jgi:RimJ/RimL family protein N-acetyltransferase